MSIRKLSKPKIRSYFVGLLNVINWLSIQRQTTVNLALARWTYIKLCRTTTDTKQKGKRNDNCNIKNMSIRRQGKKKRVRAFKTVDEPQESVRDSDET